MKLTESMPNTLEPESKQEEGRTFKIYSINCIYAFPKVENGDMVLILKTICVIQSHIKSI